MPVWLDRPTPTRRYGAMLGVGSLLGGEIDHMSPRPAPAATRRVQMERYLHRGPDPAGATRLVREWQGELNKRQLKAVTLLVNTFDQLAAELERLPTAFTVVERTEVIAAYHLARLNAG
ncbi:hypothetical protein AB0A74_26400 [Saccharothrix sp. NPDC042600]|uniref:hypothetical protein n=1 Tax=Saccharothrix TaxID=2071 RepID=UPI0033E23798|nr:hypothetical protein GCM10017745_46160 [Saccharothrix mutabilis subsp. capreolus]